MIGLHISRGYRCRTRLPPQPTMLRAKCGRSATTISRSSWPKCSWRRFPKSLWLQNNRRSDISQHLVQVNAMERRRADPTDRCVIMMTVQEHKAPGKAVRLARNGGDLQRPGSLGELPALAAPKRGY